MENPEKTTIFVSEKGNKQNTTIMDIITTIFTTILVIFIGIVAIAIFIQTNVDLWKEVKPEIKSWFNSTRIGMWYKNRKNKVKILTESEYDYLVRSGMIKSTIVIDEL